MSLAYPSPTSTAGQLAAPLDVTSDVTWIGFANHALRGDGRAASAARAEAPRTARHETLCSIRCRRSRTTFPISRDLPLLSRRAWTDGVWAPATGEGAAPVFVARAPGRLDVMGGIADYSGALVLQWPIREATRVALRRWRGTAHLDRLDRRRRPRAAMRCAARPRRRRRSPVRRGARVGSRQILPGTGRPYVAGVFHVLAREHARALRTGRGRPRRVRRARGERRQLVGRDRGRHNGGGDRGVAAADRASAARAALPAGREPDRRRAVRRHGPDGGDLR